ncbi:MAG TPA: nuclear transport factor 2 family protein [Thermoleophilaceae bacterium]|nr:nuclear transport factor 2 family protein [Thermoleophilaceae bacterium]
MIRKTDLQYGPEARNRLAETPDPSPAGARAALESFYYALNNRNIEALSDDWADHPLVQLNNPLGGMLRGEDAVRELYERIFDGPIRVEVTFGDVVEYIGERHAVFAGRETGTYTRSGDDAAPLKIRTTRYFRYEDGAWRQFHHHGSIEHAEALADYQRAASAAGASRHDAG